MSMFEGSKGREGSSGMMLTCGRAAGGGPAGSTPQAGRRTPQSQR